MLGIPARAARVMLALATLGVAAWSAGFISGDAGRCAVSAVGAAESADCCHYDQGVCGCEDGRARCCDGKVSASCRCASDGPITRGITRRPAADAQPLLGRG